MAVSERFSNNGAEGGGGGASKRGSSAVGVGIDCGAFIACVSAVVMPEGVSFGETRSRRIAYGIVGSTVAINGAGVTAAVDTSALISSSVAGHNFSNFRANSMGDIPAAVAEAQQCRICCV